MLLLIVAAMLTTKTLLLLIFVNIILIQMLFPVIHGISLNDSSRDCFYNGYDLYMLAAANSESDLPLFPLTFPSSLYKIKKLLYTSQTVSITMLKSFFLQNIYSVLIFSYMPPGNMIY